MSSQQRDAAFAGSIPEIYENCLVPLIFEPCAVDLADRVAALRPEHVLEIAAGTGVVTRQLARTLPATCPIIATDLNQAMLDQAEVVGTVRAVEWRQADALRLPFPDHHFDVVVCQFGVMFFPDKAAAFAEARRVLRPRGRLLFNVWDRIEHNEFADTITMSLGHCWPADPPRFLVRVPHGYHDRAVIGADLARGGFPDAPVFDTFSARSRAESPRLPAVAYCQGTPLRNEIEGRAGNALTMATDLAANAIGARFGAGPVDGAIQARVVTVFR
jgi:SAM-dependent methyltransferase